MRSALAQADEENSTRLKLLGFLQRTIKLLLETALCLDSLPMPAAPSSVLQYRCQCLHAASEPVEHTSVDGQHTGLVHSQKAAQRQRDLHLAGHSRVPGEVGGLHRRLRIR